MLYQFQKKSFPINIPNIKINPINEAQIKSVMFSQNRKNHPIMMK
jgi:hypothetical protein